jgi:hypothetical protein
MADDNQVKQLRKYRRQSIRALPVAVGFLMIICVGLLIVSRFITVPNWLAILLVSVSGLTVVGDTVNIVYIGRKLRKEDRA